MEFGTQGGQKFAYHFLPQSSSGQHELCNGSGVVIDESPIDQELDSSIWLSVEDIQSNSVHPSPLLLGRVVFAQRHQLMAMTVWKYARLLRS